MARFLILLFALGGLAAAQNFDVLLRGGRLIDPANGIDGLRDVGIRDGRVAAVAESLDPASAKRVLDVKGLVLTPGLVDIHVHLFHSTNIKDVWAGDNSVRPDDFSFRTGVTTMADAGSSGWRNFETFRHTVIDRAKTRVFAFINIAGFGMLSNMVEQHAEDMLPEEVAKLAKKHADVVVGVKTAHWEDGSWTAVEKSLEAGKLAGIPLMVDFGWFRAERPFWKLVDEMLRPGDIATHAFRAPVPWLDTDGKLFDYLGRARERGVKFDVGHGGGSFAFRNAVPAVAQGFWPDSISTDLHTQSMNLGMIDMPTTMSKFLAMGMPLREVVRRSTVMPARMIGKPELGHLSVGAVADIAAWRLLEGDFGFSDSDRGLLKGRRRLTCELTLLGGEVVWDWNARTGRDYRELGPEYGVRPGEVIVRPPK
ncbi:MAG: amidohydrolase/deacetylase family metallohydrolase [Bryobacteraceae bacterium]|nr:amidohydrolase/deacetylase family metallohydrolase [Bryobacteraceae bacterium]